MRSAQVSLEDKRATVVCDKALTPEALVAKIEATKKGGPAEHFHFSLIKE